MITVTEGPVPALACYLYVQHMQNRCFGFRFAQKLHEGTVILHLEAQGAEKICVCMGQPVGLRAPGWRNVVGT